jgi:hypothetical protein
VPRTREGVAAYFEEMRPKLAASPIAIEAMLHLLDGGQLVTPLSRWLFPVSWVMNKVLRAGVIGTMPRWMREMAGIRQPRFVDTAVRPVLWTTFRLVRFSVVAQLFFLAGISRGTVPVVAPVLHKVAPLSDEILTPAEARRRYGLDAPAEAHLAWRAKQHDKVFGAGEAPSDAGLIESQKILGAL